MVQDEVSVITPKRIHQVAYTAMTEFVYTMMGLQVSMESLDKGCRWAILTPQTDEVEPDPNHSVRPYESLITGSFVLGSICI